MVGRLTRQIMSDNVVGEARTRVPDSDAYLKGGVRIAREMQA